LDWQGLVGAPRNQKSRQPKRAPGLFARSHAPVGGFAIFAAPALGRQFCYEPSWEELIGNDIAQSMPIERETKVSFRFSLLKIQGIVSMSAFERIERTRLAQNAQFMCANRICPR
jgi:hypothetical protein